MMTHSTCNAIHLFAVLCNQVISIIHNSKKHIRHQVILSKQWQHIYMKLLQGFLTWIADGFPSNPANHKLPMELWSRVFWRFTGQTVGDVCVILFRSHIATQQFPVRQKHNHRLKLTTHGLSLVRMKSRYGIRVIATEEAAHRDHVLVRPFSRLTFPRSNTCTLCHMGSNDSKSSSCSKNGSGNRNHFSPHGDQLKAVHARWVLPPSHQPTCCLHSTRMFWFRWSRTSRQLTKPPQWHSGWPISSAKTSPQSRCWCCIFIDYCWSLAVSCARPLAMLQGGCYLEWC